MSIVLRDVRIKRLVVLNAALFGLLAVALAMPAGAQNSGTPRARGEYTMISGRTNSGGNNAVYIVDSVNQEMIAVRWDTGRKSFTGIGYRNLDADSKAQPGR